MAGRNMSIRNVKAAITKYLAKRGGEVTTINLNKFREAIAELNGVPRYTVEQALNELISGNQVARRKVDNGLRIQVRLLQPA